MDSSNPYELQVFTRRNSLLLLASCSLVIGFGGGVRAVAGLGIFLFVLFLLDTVLCLLGATRLSTKRNHYPRTFEGMDVGIELELTNAGIWAASLVEAIDNFPPGPHPRIRQVATFVRGKEKLVFNSRQPCIRRRGLYLLGPVTLQSTSPLGLFSTVDSTDDITRLLVYPSIEPMPGFNVLEGGTHAHVGSEIVNAIGRSTEFRGIRRYRPGDPPSWIHWRSTARHLALYVKEFDRNVSTEVTIFCDLFLVAQSGLGDFTSVETRLKVAGSVAHEAIRKNHMVRMVAVKEPRQATRMAGGNSQITVILDWMTTLRAEGSGSFEENIIEESQLLRRGSTAVLVLSSIHLNATMLEKAILTLRQRTIFMIAVVVDDRTFIKLRSEQEEYYRSAVPLNELVSLLVRHGIPTYAIGSQDDIRQKLGAA